MDKDPDAPKIATEEKIPHSISSPSSLTSSFLRNDKKYFDGALCIQGKKCCHVCIEQKCEGIAILCADQECKCRVTHYSEHDTCMLIDPKIVLQRIFKKMYNMPKAISKIEEIVLKLTDQLSEIQIKITKNLQNCNISVKERELFDLLEQNKFKFLSRKILAGVMEDIKVGKELLPSKMEEENELIEAWAKKEKELEKIVDSLSPFEDKGKAKEKEKATTIGIYEQSPYFKDSNIIKSKQEVTTLVGFLSEGKTVNEIRKLYAASQAQFCTYKFHEKCDNIPTLSQWR